MSVDLANLMLEGTGGATWTVDEFRAMNPSALRKFATWNGDSTASLPVEWQQKVQEKGFTAADSEVALRVFTSPEGKSTAHNRPVAYLSTHGGSFTYFPNKVVYSKVSGEKMERSNSPIPAKFGEVDKYDNLQAVAAFCAQLVRSEKGHWEVMTNVETWMKVAKDSQLNISGLMMVASRVKTLLTEDRVWKGMPVISKSAITGEEHLCFVREALNRLPKNIYDILNTMIVAGALKTFEKKNDRWIFAKKDDGTRVVDPKCYRAEQTDKQTLAQLKKRYPGCYWYYAGVGPLLLFPEAKGDLKSTLENVQRSTEIKGSDQSATSILAQMRGYSGLTDSFGKRIEFLLAAALGVWALGRPVNVAVDTVGDVGIIFSSLKEAKRTIERLQDPTFKIGDIENPCEFKFILPRSTDKAKVNRLYHEYLITRPDPKAVVIFHHISSLPTSETKGKLTDYDKFSEIIVPEYLHEVDFVMYTTIFGACPFKNDLEVKRSLASSLSKIDQWRFDPNVFLFGSAAKFNGVISNMPNVNLIGFGYPKLESGYDEREMKFVVLPLTSVKLQSTWYLEVVKDARVQCIAWLNPLTRYSPISNLPYMSKGGASLMATQVIGESGVLIGNTLRPKHFEGARPVIDEFVNEDRVPKSDEEEQEVPLLRKTKKDQDIQKEKHRVERDKDDDEEDPVPDQGEDDEDDDKDLLAENPVVLMTGEEKVQLTAANL